MVVFYGLILPLGWKPLEGERNEISLSSDIEGGVVMPLICHLFYPRERQPFNMGQEKMKR